MNKEIKLLGICTYLRNFVDAFEKAVGDKKDQFDNLELNV